MAVIAIRDLRDGLQDMVDVNELVKALKNLLPGLGDYIRMLNHIKSAYQRDAARFLQILIYAPLFQVTSFLGVIMASLISAPYNSVAPSCNPRMLLLSTGKSS